MKKAHMCLAILAFLILAAAAPTAPAQEAYTVRIESNDTPHDTTIYAGAGEFVNARVIIENVTEPKVAGSSLFLRFDPDVIEDVSCLDSDYNEPIECEMVEPGIFLFEGDDSPDSYTGDVVVVVLQITTNGSAEDGASTVLNLTADPGDPQGSPVWGPFGDDIDVTFEDGMLVIQNAVGPEIAVEKTAVPGEGVPGDNITFNITVQNTGAEEIDNVSIIDTLPEGLSYASSEPAGDRNNSTVVWEVDEPLLVNGSPISFSLVAVVDDGVSGTLENYVDVSGETAQGQPVLSSAMATVSIIDEGVSITKTAEPSVGRAGMNVTFNITVANMGSTDIQNATVVDTLPAGMSYVSSNPLGNQTGSTVVWEIDEPLLTNGSPISFSLVSHIDQGTTGDLVNSVTVEGITADDRLVADNSTAVVNLIEPDIDVEKSANPTAGTPLTPVNFTINVTNTGDAVLQNVTVADVLPEGLEYISSTPNGTIQNGTVTWYLGTIPIDETLTLEIGAMIGQNATGILDNSVTAFADAEGARVTDTDAVAVEVLDEGAKPREIHIVGIGTQTSDAIEGGLASNTINISSAQNGPA